jgi:hypothetical protein
MKHNIAFWGPAVLLFVCSCSTESALQRIIGSNASAPVFYGSRIGTEGEVHFRFSVPVKVVSMYFDRPLDAEVTDSGETVSIRINSELAGGEKITADILVEDENRNTLNLIIPFRTRNERLPGLVINEIRTVYSGSGKTPKVEFIELKATSQGSLGALRLFAAYEKDEIPLWEFPPAEVNKGDYIVLHTRIKEPGTADETGPNLALSGGAEAQPSARDFWMPVETKLHNTNVIYLMDQDGAILDGVFFRDKDVAAKEGVTKAAAMLEEAGAWKGDPADVSDTTATRTICRDEKKTNSNTAVDWYVTVSSGNTPGLINNEKRYSK